MEHSSSFDKHRQIQSAAKKVLKRLAQTIRPASTEQSIATSARALLAEEGLTETWYHDCPALVLLGSRSCHSESGRTYRPADEQVGQLNLVTVDLSPTVGLVWGDCARSFFIENGKVTTEPQFGEFRQGQEVQQLLHRELLARAEPYMSLEAVSVMASDILKSQGFENLDFLGNVGHTITDTLNGRQWVKPGTTTSLCDAGLFTFEPHIRKLGGQWGFKHEDIYFVGPNGQLNVL